MKTTCAEMTVIQTHVHSLYTDTRTHEHTNTRRGEQKNECMYARMHEHTNTRNTNTQAHKHTNTHTNTYAHLTPNNILHFERNTIDVISNHSLLLMNV